MNVTKLWNNIIERKITYERGKCGVHRNKMYTCQKILLTDCIRLEVQFYLRSCIYV